MLDMLKTHIDISINSNPNDPKISFFVIRGTQINAKNKSIIDLSKEILWQYFQNDFLHIKDFSTQLKKQHNIKVEADWKETYKTLLNEHNYKDIWTREINSRLQQSSTGKLKIVLIENIERMGIGAINAFLKTCEEPLPNRIIIATTANESQIIDTVISRSISINFSTNDIDSEHDFTKDLDSAVKILATDTNIHNKHQILSDINKKWLIKPFLDVLITYYVSQNDFKNSDKRLKIKEMSWVNVNMDNLLFYGLLD